jgi:hypothetical protein
MTSAVTPIFIVAITIGLPALVATAYFRLQQHRADAVGAAGYRKLAEEAVANQRELRDQLVALNERVGAVEEMMRSVG